MTLVEDFGDSYSSSRNIQAREKSTFFLVFLFDFLALAIAYKLTLWAAMNIFGEGLPASMDGMEHVIRLRAVIYSCISIAVLFFLHANDHYSRRIPWWTQLQHIARILCFGSLLDIFSNYGFDLKYPGMLIAGTWLTALLLLVAGRLVLNKIRCRSASWTLPAVIIAGSDMATDSLYALAADAGLGLSVRAILLRDKDAASFDREELPAGYRDIDILPDAEMHENYILRHPHHFYIVCLESFPDDRRDRIVKLLRDCGIQFSLMPAISRTSMYQTRPRYLFGNDVMLLDPINGTTAGYYKFMKRAIDITGASVALVIFAVPMLIVAIMLKLEGQGGTPIYAGPRVGQDGRLFRCYKFRTMEPGTDHLLHNYLATNPEAKAYWDRYFKLPNDPRVQTRTARFIRKASIDELPQFWNVLKGDMSLVGPRPILENEIAAYGDRIDEYISVRPGITGLWQASGRAGTSFQRRVVWDSWYVRNWSIWGDIVIILKTIQAVLSRSGAS